MTSKIEWTQETWNPITGCTKVSPGCKNCYAEKMHKRLRAMRQGKYQHDFNEIHFHKDELQRHFGKNKLVFVCSMCDLFHEDVETNWINSIILYAAAQRATFQVLTKRSERMRSVVFPNNFWVGVTVENADYKYRIEHLKETVAKTRFISFEPLLGDVGELNLDGIDWVIAGAESGPGMRECKIEWIENIVLQATAAKVPVFVKQAHIDGKLVKMPHIFGSEWAEYPNAK